MKKESGRGLMTFGTAKIGRPPLLKLRRVSKKAQNSAWVHFMVTHFGQKKGGTGIPACLMSC